MLLRKQILAITGLILKLPDLKSKIVAAIDLPSAPILASTEVRSFNQYDSVKICVLILTHRSGGR